MLWNIWDIWNLESPRISEYQERSRGSATTSTYGLPPGTPTDPIGALMATWGS